MQVRKFTPHHPRRTDAPPGLTAGAPPAGGSRRTRPQLWLLCLAAVVTALFAILLVPPMTSANAAGYGPGFDDADNGGQGRVGAYRVDGQNRSQSA